MLNALAACLWENANSARYRSVGRSVGRPFFPTKFLDPRSLAAAACAAPTDRPASVCPPSFRSLARSAQFPRRRPAGRRSSAVARAALSLVSRNGDDWLPDWPPLSFLPSFPPSLPPHPPCNEMDITTRSERAAHFHCVTASALKKKSIKSDGRTRKRNEAVTLEPVAMYVHRIYYSI